MDAFRVFATWWLSWDIMKSLFLGMALLAAVLPALIDIWDW